LIGLGAVLLLNNLGLLTWSIWDAVLVTWPILLVAAGLDILIGRRSALGSLLALLVTLALFAWVVWLFGSEAGAGEASGGAEFSQPLSGAAEARIVINPGVGRLHLDALTDSANLVEGSIPRSFEDSVERDFEVEGETATFSLRPPGAAIDSFVGSAGRGLWAVRINPEVPVHLDLDLGMGETQVDMTGLTVRDVQVSMGLGQTTVILPDEDGFQATIEGAIGQTTVIIPQGLALRIKLDTGIAGRQLPPDYQRQDNIYTSPGYEGADNQAELQASQAIGRITIRYSE
jgi:hypothetical protein